MTKSIVLKRLVCLGLALGFMADTGAVARAGELVPGQWSVEKAWKWTNAISPIKGCNYNPRTSINSTEMWQAETFDPETIDQELGWARQCGYNSIRVFLQFLVWRHDPDGMIRRMEQFLRIADKHKISVMFVPFCDCQFSGIEPYLGPQKDPVPGVHNGHWMASPGHKSVTDKAVWPYLEQYIKAIVGRFGRDDRVLIWDLYNEPYARGIGEKSLPLVEAAFAWAREAKPQQPLTIGAWKDFESQIQRRLMELSDVVSFHGYDQADGLLHKINLCSSYKRPTICTECLTRVRGSSFDVFLPVFAEHRIGWYNWGLVAGRTQTYMPWGSKPNDPPPNVWHHDILNPDGTPHNPEEIPLIKRFSFQKPKVLLPISISSQQTWKYTFDERQALVNGKQAAKPRPSLYRGWRAYVLENDLVKLHVVPDIGGRVIQYALGEKEFLWINPALLSATSPTTGLDPNGGWLNYGGDKLWPAPQGWENDEQWPGPPDGVLDGRPYHAETDLDPPGIRLTSRDDRRSGIRFSRTIRFHLRSTRVSIEATMTNIDTKPRRWGIWAHTQLDAGLPGTNDYNRLMRAWCPINPRSRFERGYRVIFGEKDNPSFEADAKRGLMKVSYNYKVGKIGLDSHAGWVATVDGRNGDVFVQRFTFEPDKAYPDESSVEFWHNGVGRIHAYDKWIDMADDRDENPYVFESEVLSPFARLQPGESYTWTYDWCACRIGGDFPVVDCSEAGVVSEPLACRPHGPRVRLTGRFGVFHLGRIALKAYNEKAEVVATEILDSNATPLKLVLIDRVLKLPRAARSVTLVLHDTRGKPIAELDRCKMSPPLSF